MVAIFAVIAHLMPFQDATRQEQRRPILTVVTQEGNITKHEIVLCSIVWSKGVQMLFKEDQL